MTAIRDKLAARRAARDAQPKAPAPRYDETFFSGLAELESQPTLTCAFCGYTAAPEEFYGYAGCWPFCPECKGT